MSPSEPFASGGIVRRTSSISAPLLRSMSLPDLVSYALSFDPDNAVLTALRDKLKGYVTKGEKLDHIEISLMDIQNDLETALREIRELKNGSV